MYNCFVTKAIGNNEERKENHSTETQDFNVENPLQQREVKTTGACSKTSLYRECVYKLHYKITGLFMVSKLSFEASNVIVSYYA
jgi:hypothetical protein